jgi:ABC-type uncharacterized transport system substrate-binding protein
MVAVLLFVSHLAFGEEVIIPEPIAKTKTTQAASASKAGPFKSQESPQNNPPKEPLPPSPYRFSRPYRVLLVFDRPKEDRWVVDSQKGIAKALKNFPVVFRYAYLVGDDNATNATAAQIREEIHQWHPAVVIASGEISAQKVVRPMVNTSNAFVVFGMHSDPKDLGFILDSPQHPGRNVTGVLPASPLLRAMRLAKEICDKVHRAVFLTDTPAESKLVLKDLEREFLPLEVESIQIAETEEIWLKIIKGLQFKIDVVIISGVSHLTTDSGEPVNVEKLVKKAIAHSPLMGIALSRELVRYGILAGVEVTPYLYGLEAGKKAREVLNGVAVGEVPFSAPPEPSIFVNLSRARQLGIEIPPSVLMEATFIYP